MPDLQAVIFDLDGVLIDSEHAWDEARRALTEEAGGRWRDGATEEMMGMSAPEWSRYLRDELDVPLAPEEIDRQVVARLLASYEQELPLLPGAVAAVKRMRERWPLGLASSSNPEVIEAVLEASGLASCFGVALSSQDVARGKPAPDVYLAAAERLGVEPQHVAAIEDSSNGLRAAGAAGMVVVAIPNQDFPPEQDALEAAAICLDSIDELTVKRLEAE